MSIQLKNEIIVKIDEEKNIAIVIESPYAKDDVVIPRYVENQGKNIPITTISNHAFVDNEYINSISFPEDSELQCIKKGAFSHSSLTKLVLPASITELEDGFCSGAAQLVHIEVSANNKKYISINNEFLLKKGENDQCNLLFVRRNIENVTIPANVSQIRPYSFDSCKNLKSVSFSSSKIEEFCNFAFTECSNLEEITIPASVIRIGERCFNACKKLQKVTISKDSKLRTIGKFAFFHTSIVNLSIPASTDDLKEGFCSGTNFLNSIEISEENKKYSSFNGEYLTTKGENNGTELLFVRRNIETFSIPSSIRKIGGYAFQTCHKLTSVTFSVPPTSSGSFIDTIDDHSFSECLSLEQIEIPANIIKRIGKSAFSSCKALKTVTFVCPPNSNSILEDIDDNSFSGCENLEEIVIPSTVRRIGASCFQGCNKLRKISFSKESSLQSVGNYCFSYCSSIEEITIPCSIKSIGEFAFNSCSSLRNVTFDGQAVLTVFSGFIFAYCSSLESFTIPETVKVIGQSAFKSCNKLKKVHFTSSNSQLEEIGVEAFDGCCELVTFDFPQSLKHIKNFAFKSCKNLTSFHLLSMSKIEIIGKGSFNNCLKIEKFTLPSTVVRIGESAFESCTNLNEFVIQENSELQFIGAYAFANSKLEKLFIPAKVDQIEEGFCMNMDKLIKIDVSKLNQNYSMIDNDNYLVKKEGENDNDLVIIFSRRNIENVTIPPKVKRIGKYAFNNCKLLKSISFSSGDNECSLETIDSFAFSNCTSISELSIPNSVKKIGDSSFIGCNELKSVIFVQPPGIKQMEYNSFANCPNLKDLDVPSSVIKITKNISDFFDIPE